MTKIDDGQTFGDMLSAHEGLMPMPRYGGGGVYVYVGVVVVGYTLGVGMPGSHAPRKLVVPEKIAWET